MNKPSEEHQYAVHRICRYLKMDPDRGIFFQEGATKGIEICSDADWAP